MPDSPPPGDDEKRYPGDIINGGMFEEDELDTSDCKYFIKSVRGGSYSIVYCSLRGKIKEEYCLDCMEYTNPKDERGIPDPNPF